jgi:hypothetical protein
MSSTSCNLCHAQMFEELLANVVCSWVCNQVASRMVSAFSRWRRYDKTRQDLAKVTYSLRPKITIILASQKIILIKYILKILIFILHN